MSQINSNCNSTEVKGTMFDKIFQNTLAGLQLLENAIFMIHGGKDITIDGFRYSVQVPLFSHNSSELVLLCADFMLDTTLSPSACRGSHSVLPIALPILIVLTGGQDAPSLLL